MERVVTRRPELGGGWGSATAVAVASPSLGRFLEVMVSGNRGDYRGVIDIRAENIGRAKIDQPGWGRGTVLADDQAEPEGRKIFVKWTRNLSVSHRHGESIG
jgi:hypothetical protein